MLRKPEEPPLDIAPGGGAAHSPYPDFDVASADKWAFDWDEKTRRLVIARVRDVPPYRFFPEKEIAILEGVCAWAILQDDRAPAQRVPIAPWIDERLFKDEGDGYRYADMPNDREAYRLGLEGFDQTAQILFHANFVELDSQPQDKVIQSVAAGKPPGENWQQMSAQKFFQELMKDMISNYYAHPAAWAEIGFSGPASPRGHIRLSLGQRDPWEAAERRGFSSVEIVRRARGKGSKAKG